MKESTFQTRYPHYNVLDKWSSPDWDDQTREVVRERLEEVPPIRFFTEKEADLLETIAERIMPQPDRHETEKVPIVSWIDENSTKISATVTATRECRRNKTLGD